MGEPERTKGSEERADGRSVGSYSRFDMSLGISPGVDAKWLRRYRRNCR